MREQLGVPEATARGLSVLLPLLTESGKWWDFRWGGTDFRPGLPRDCLAFMHPVHEAALQ